MELTYLLLGLANNGWEDCFGSIFACQPGLATTGAVVNDDGSLIVRHV